jgi:hypothetical protein
MPPRGQKGNAIGPAGACARHCARALAAAAAVLVLVLAR